MKICSICSEKHEGLGFCRKHYRSFKKHGTPFPPKRKSTKGYVYKTKVKCKLCENLVKAKGLCNNHYQNLKISGSPYGKTGRRRRNNINNMLEIIDKIVPNENGCKIWTMGINSAGYGHFSIKNKSYNVSRLLYKTIFPGDYEKKVIRHTCDVRSCCNINHLEFGTQKDNIHDIIKRNRGLFGKKNN